MTHHTELHKRMLALYVLCAGVLMIVLDTTIVNVALPSIREDLGFTETSLVWVVNAYMLTFGGFLLLGGRLGDLYGHPAERAKAMGIYGFVCAAGGSIGVLLGGVLTSAISWHWIFLVNLPIGVAVYALCRRLVSDMRAEGAGTRLDIAGAVTVTTSMLLAVYAVVNGNEAGWTSTQTLGLLGAASVLFAMFLAIEAKVRHPLVPLRLFRMRNLATANVVGTLWAAAMFAWFFISALYLQLVLGYSALEVGLAFLPANLVMAVFSVGLSAKLVNRFGLRLPLSVGLLLAAAGLGLFARAPVDGNFALDVLPAMVLLGVGAGVALNPVLLAAMSDVEPSESGLASGVVNTSFMMGGSLGLAVFASLAAARTGDLLGAGAAQSLALNGGYRLAFAVAAIFALVAAVLSALLLRSRPASTLLEPS